MLQRAPISSPLVQPTLAVRRVHPAWQPHKHHKNVTAWQIKEPPNLSRAHRSWGQKPSPKGGEPLPAPAWIRGDRTPGSHGSSPSRADPDAGADPPQGQTSCVPMGTVPMGTASVAALGRHKSPSQSLARAEALGGCWERHWEGGQPRVGPPWCQLWPWGSGTPCAPTSWCCAGRGGRQAAVVPGPAVPGHTAWLGQRRSWGKGGLRPVGDEAQGEVAAVARGRCTKLRCLWQPTGSRQSPPVPPTLSPTSPKPWIWGRDAQQ